MYKMILPFLFLVSYTNIVGAQKIKLKVMSYNIRSFEPSFNTREHIKLIKAEKPDFIAFQEVENRTSRIERKDLIIEIGAATGMFPLFAPAYKKDVGEYGVAILTRYPILSSYFIPLPRLQTEGAADPRVAIIADILLPDNIKLRFANTHLDHMHGNGNIQLEQAKPLTSKKILDGNSPVILAGDFNQGINGNAIKYLTDSFDRQCNDTYTYEYGSKLDYIFTYPKGKWQAIEKKTMHNIELSDHYPVISTLEYNP